RKSRIIPTPPCSGSKGTDMRLSVAAACAFALLLAACSREPEAPHGVPLSFVPADTPYVYANIDPLPAALTEQWAKPMQDYWPRMFDMYEAALNQSRPHASEETLRLVLAVLDELKTHASWARLREFGIKPDARLAFYGIGLVPVLRLELADPA